ncbi:MAG: cell wall-binding repeat-containing protein, partial [Anaerotignum sp.]|nr:cell wall-binding repeat-containing protein [Anaerotignum sp.]
TPKTPITSAKISDVTTPVVGATPDFDITLTGTGVAFDEEEGSFFWEKYTDAWYDLDEDTPFGADLNMLTVYLIAQDGYKFTGDTKFYFGEEELPEWGDVDFGESCYEVDGDYASMYIYFDPADAPKVPITSVKLSDVTTPVAGATPDLDFTLTAVGADFDSWDPPCWYKYNSEHDAWQTVGTTFSEGYYKLEVWLAAKDGYEFTEDIEAFFGEKKLPEWDDASDGESCYMYDSEEYVGFYLYFNVEDAAMDDVYRVYGLSRCDTALKAADTLKEEMDISKFDTVIVANAQNFADALGGSYLAAKKDAPILMTNIQNEAKVKEYIRNNLKNGGTIYILGGPLAVASSFETGMGSFNVKRLYGTSRYDTNLEILKEASMARAASKVEVLVCTGTNFADSLSASATGKPILMVGNSLTANQKEYLRGLNAEYTIIGGPLAVNANVENELKALGDTERIYGTSRFDTSVVVAQQFFRSPATMVLAYAQNFPDGLSGGPLAYHVDGPLVLTQNGKQAVAAAYADANDIKGGYVMGGTILISDDTVRDIFDMAASDPVIVK